MDKNNFRSDETTDDTRVWEHSPQSVLPDDEAEDAEDEEPLPESPDTTLPL